MRWFILIAFAFVLLHAYATLSLGWNYPLSDWHGFRQTQTAISAYFISIGGPLLAYHTPVLGSGWSIPFEFPLYQWLVAGWSTLSGSDLNQSGRSVGILFFFLCLLPQCWILKLFQVEPIHRIIFLAVFLCSPFYLFWSRTFLIESTALFFALLYLAACLHWFRKQELLCLILSVVGGVTAALVKGTTLGFLLIIVLIVGLIWSLRTPKPPLTRVALWMFAFLFLPLFSTWIWTNFADAQKAQVPLATFIQSKALNQWNFGKLEDRWSFHLWKDIIYDRATPEILGSSYTLLLLVVLTVLSLKRFKHVSACVAFYLGTFLVFTNLHQVHNYYQYAQGVFLLGAVSFAIVGCIEAGGYRAFIGNLGLILVLWFAYQGYVQRGFQEMLLKGKTSPYVEVGRVLRKSTNPEQVLLIYGLDWSSEVPYYARRRAIMDRESLPLTDARMRETLTKSLDNEKRSLGAMVVCGSQRVDFEFVQSRAHAFNLEEKPSFKNAECDVYSALKSEKA